MDLDTRPAALDASGAEDRWAPFRITHPQECAAVLRQLRDGQVPVILNGPDGSSMTTTLWSAEAEQGRVSFTADHALPAVPRLVEADEAVAVAYMDAVKLQFDLHRIVLVRGAQTSTLQCAWPPHVYRFQRRGAYRVRAPQRHGPTARFRHPSIPDMALALRVLDVSIGGCALWLPQNLPPLQPGTQLRAVAVDLDISTRFAVGLTLQHVTAGPGDGGVRLGCEWLGMAGHAQRVLQRWIDQTQKRLRLLAVD